MRGKNIINKDRAGLLAQADELISDISDISDILVGYNAVMTDEIEKIKIKFAEQIWETTDILKELEKKLTALMKKNSGIIFDGEERVDLEHGSLLFSIETRIKKAQGVLEKLKQQGFSDAIKIVESVDWDKMEEWPVEKLAIVGTKRDRKEHYAWEIKEGK